MPAKLDPIATANVTPTPPNLFLNLVVESTPTRKPTTPIALNPPKSAGLELKFRKSGLIMKKVNAGVAMEEPRLDVPVDPVMCLNVEFCKTTRIPSFISRKKLGVPENFGEGSFFLMEDNEIAEAR